MKEKINNSQIEEKANHMLVLINEEKIRQHLSRNGAIKINKEMEVSERRQYLDFAKCKIFNDIICLQGRLNND